MMAIVTSALATADAVPEPISTTAAMTARTRPPPRPAAARGLPRARPLPSAPALRPPNRRVCNHRCTGPRSRNCPGPQVLHRHSHPGDLVVGRGAVTAAVDHDYAVATPFLPLRSRHVLCHPDPRYYRVLTCGVSSPMASTATVDLPGCPRHIAPPGAAIHDRQRRSGGAVPQLCGRDPPHASTSLAQDSPPASRYVPLNPFSTVLVSDLDRPFCHPVAMSSDCVTPMHHPMSMGSSANCRPPSRCRA
jgi:hypothetical protein